MAYWLFKSEPGAWSWDDQVTAGTAEWDGIRNYQADNNMKAMEVGDKAFFYHSKRSNDFWDTLYEISNPVRVNEYESVDRGPIQCGGERSL